MLPLPATQPRLKPGHQAFVLPDYTLKRHKPARGRDRVPPNFSPLAKSLGEKKRNIPLCRRRNPYCRIRRAAAMQSWLKPRLQMSLSELTFTVHQAVLLTSSLGLYHKDDIFRVFMSVLSVFSRR